MFVLELLFCFFFKKKIPIWLQDYVKKKVNHPSFFTVLHGMLLSVYSCLISVKSALQGTSLKDYLSLEHKAIFSSLKR